MDQHPHGPDISSSPDYSPSSQTHQAGHCREPIGDNEGSAENPTGLTGRGLEVRPWSGESSGCRKLCKHATQSGLSWTTGSALLG